MAKPGFGDACSPLWVTEVGYNVDQLVGKVKQTEAGQANFLRDVYTTLGARRLGADCANVREIAAIFWFKYEDFPPAADVKDRFGNVLVPAQKWGVVRITFDANAVYDPSGEPVRYRPSYWAYMDLTGKLLRVYAPLTRR